MMKYRTAQSGFSFVEAIVVAALSALIFGALFASFQYTLQLINNSRAKLSAQAVASDRMEYFRSLPYDQVGVIAGFPAGAIPQTSTVTLNGIDFAERVRVDYVDDPADGSGASDSNAITTDYKQIRLEYEWWVGNATSSIALISTIVPRSIETDVGGGTARINVLNADNSLLAGATVRLTSASTTFTYDVTNTTDTSGAAVFAVPSDSGYSAEVTALIGGRQYSIDGTITASPANPNPSSAPFAVLESDVSTLTFKIGELSDLELSTFSSRIEGGVVEEFPNLDGVASSTNVDTALNSLVLSDSFGVYETTGRAYLQAISPAMLLRWETVRVAVDLPGADTSHFIQFFTGSSTSGYVLIPDGDLPGNALGFTDSLIDISVLDTGGYPDLVVGVTLETSDTSETPAVDEIAVYYRESDVTLAADTVTVTGAKTIGVDSLAMPIYKYENTLNTDGSGELITYGLEFDSYRLGISGLDIASACPGSPIIHQAGIDTQSEIAFVSNNTHTLRVHVRDGLGRSIPGAEVNLRRPGYDQTRNTDICGQVFFSGGVTSDTDWQLSTSVAGFAADNQTAVTIDGDTVSQVNLLP